jgi:hypothetical protein
MMRDQIAMSKVVSEGLFAGRTMIFKTYVISCQLPPQTASDRIKDLLSKEGVKYSAANFSLTSLSTPIVVVGIQPKLYSHSNWVGLNPFTFISGVDVCCEREDEGLTKVTVRVNRRRAFLWFLYWVTLSFFVARAMPEPGGAILFIGITCAAWFGIVRFLGGYLIKKEIGDYLISSVQH